MRCAPLALVLPLALAACGDPTAAGPGAGSRVLVALKDGNAAVLSRADQTASAAVAPAMAISTDAVFRAEPDALYVVNRFGGDNVVLLDPLDLHVVKQFSTGSGTNPQDVAVLAPTKVYVPLYQTAAVLVADPTQPDGAEVLSTISLADIDADASPTSAVIVGTELYVALAFIDPTTYAPKRDAMVAVIDTATDEVTAQIALPGENPFARMQRVPGTGTLVLNLAADFGGQDGCFAAVDGPARSAACVVTNAACGGWSGALWAQADGQVVAAVAAGFQVDGTLCHFTVAGTIVKAGLAVAGSLTDVGVTDRGEIYAVDTKGDGGLWLIDLATDTPLVSAPLDLGAAPAFASGVVFLP